MAINLGVTIGPAIGGFLAIINYRLLFWFDARTCLAAAMFIIFIFKNAEFTNIKKEINATSDEKNPWTDYFYLILFFLLFLTGIIFVQLLNTWPLYLKSIYNLVEDQIGLLFAINGLLIVFFELSLIHSVDRKSILKIVAIGAILFAAGTVIIWTFGEMLVLPLVAGLIANRASDSNRGRYMVMFSLTFSLAFVIGPALGSWIYDSFGPQFLWAGAGVLGFIIMIGLFILERYQSKTTIHNRPNPIRI